MSELHPHWFHLKPLNEKALEVVNHPDNAHLVATVDGRPALRIGHMRSISGSTTLATLGRGQTTDVFVGSSSISKIQCSFEIDLDTNVVMLYDRSNGQTTQVFGQNATPFEHGRIRRVVVLPKMNTQIGMGGVARKLIHFQLVWNLAGPSLTERIQGRRVMATTFAENPRLARTIDDADTALPSRRQTRIHTPGSGCLQMRYYRGDELGAGTYGIVYEGIDADTGRTMAVKILKPGPRDPDGFRKAVKREIEFLTTLEHPHIIEYIDANCGGPEVEIFMGLMEHNLGSLIESGTHVAEEIVFHHMLQALDYFAFKGVIHRDVKPENIFCNATPDGGHHFRLGDFGLSNHIADARTFAGTGIYMAPEFFSGEEQTDKSDVYSLYVTMIWVLDVSNFRTREFKHYKDIQLAVAATMKDQRVHKIRKMAAPQLTKRASAAEMLIECFDGLGLTTPRSRVVLSAAGDEDEESKIPAPPVPVPSLATRGKERKLIRDTQNVIAEQRVRKARRVGQIGVGRIGQNWRDFP